ncbi:MAG: hypothetical protein LBL92_04185, partial [Propionibacteriaceae bacterium]|nr:hypothetical protein [Propionibacteriaceae bacterium]
LKLKLPGNQNWVVAWSLGRGTFVAGRERRVGATLVGCNSHTALPDGPTLRLTVAQKNGLLNLTK